MESDQEDNINYKYIPIEPHELDPLLNSLVQSQIEPNMKRKTKKQICTWVVIITFLLVVIVTVFTMFVKTGTYDYCWGYENTERRSVSLLSPFDLKTNQWFNADQHNQKSKIELFSKNNKWPINYRTMDKSINDTITVENDSCRILSFANSKHKEFLCRLKNGKERDCTQCDCYQIQIN
ncbi:hypothetical protein M0812_24318 [Anaeramoeba flamelloides]|uniref:Uncharacterized protein n=1 Tax=Anaeramoeba flamelloides TaxID=1746091 RepID=A0AAV7YNE1_9EUKA|nr:hypothetical protein M0812_24318 [Anaeramoeba flamelloides]